MSMLNMPLLQSEDTIGLLCCEFLEVQDEFSADTIAFCASVSDIIVLAFETEGLKQSKQELEIKNKLLKENMDQIINMQSEIIDREKLATLGMLIAGIAHEINSPLGAIKASNDFLHRIFIDSFITSIKNLTPETIKAGLGLFALLDYKLVANTTRDIRMFQKELLAKLNQSFPALENKVFYANVLMELGLQNKSQQYENYIKHPDKKSIFYFTQQLVDISKSVNTISLAVNRAGAVVKALNTFSHGSVDYEIGNFNLHESFSSVITLLWNKIKYSAYIENTIPTEINITGNADELSQVWTNIINNALQASDNKCTISIEYAEDAKNHIISISNNGPAIPEDIIPKIFDAFFSTKKRGEGTGLGLNIIKKIIEKHQGNIVCHSNSSKTTFLISLPKVLNENSVS
jgi:signal transduction histidine kinase